MIKFKCKLYSCRNADLILILVVAMTNGFLFKIIFHYSNLGGEWAVCLTCLALISPILLYGSEIWGVDCNDQIEIDPAELVQIKFLKWLLGVNKYCSNNACRAETGKLPIKIEAQYRNFKFWLTLTKHLKHKLSRVVYDDMKSRMNKELWSQKIKCGFDQIGLEYLWTKAHENDIGILNIMKQRLIDIELQRWLSDINNDVRNHANQKNKLRTF